MVNRSALLACMVVALLCVALFNSGSGQTGSELSFSQAHPSGQLFRLDQMANAAPSQVETQKAIDEAVEFDRSIAGLNEWSRETAGQAIEDFKLTVVPKRDHHIPVPVSQIRLVTFTSNPVSQDTHEDDSKAKLFPVPQELISEIEQLRNNSLSANWANNVIAILDAISKTTADSQQLQRYFQQLDVVVAQARQVAMAVWNSDAQSKQASAELASEIARIEYRISRRLAVWRSLQYSQLVQSQSKTQNFRSARFRRISFGDLDARWVEYLKLGEYKSAFESLNPDPKEKKKVSRAVLSRIYSPVLQKEQSAFIQQIIDPEIVDVLKQHASAEVDPEDLLEAVERFETNNSALTGYYLNDHYQSLLWSDAPAHQTIAAELQAHYRNANFRLAVSDRLLNRMIPVLPSTAEPVSENIKGAMVRGQSRVSNQLRVSLDPDPLHLALRLETAGHVRSDTVARTKTFKILNQGEAQFAVHKRLLIGRDGINASEKPFSVSAANQHVVGVESKLDNVPILGWVARRMAEKKLREDAPETDRMFRNKVTNAAESRVEQEVEKGLAKLRQYAYANLLQPLISLELEPEPIQLATLQHQLVIRYRLAGRDQMAANTARPRDNGNSLLSFQMHQSMINNAVARIGLNGEKFSGEELKQHFREVFGGSPQDNFTDEKSEQEVQVQFAAFDPMHIAFENNRLAITLNLKSLKVGDNGKRLKNISMTAAYQVQTSGMHVYLTQDDQGTLIRGKRLKLFDKAAVSTVMKVLFKKEYDFNVLPTAVANKINGQYLEVSQLVVSNGWIGVSIDDRVNSQDPTNAAPQAQRFSNLRRALNRR